LGLRLWLRYMFRPYWVTFPVWGWFALWMALQVFGVMQQLNGLATISSLAHLGGAGVGILAWWVWRRIEVAPELLPNAEAGAAPPVRHGRGR
jgi:membrane associated rhomboid family serine protease